MLQDPGGVCGPGAGGDIDIAGFSLALIANTICLTDCFSRAVFHRVRTELSTLSPDGNNAETVTISVGSTADSDIAASGSCLHLLPINCS